MLVSGARAGLAGPPSVGGAGESVVDGVAGCLLAGCFPGVDLAGDERFPAGDFFACGGTGASALSEGVGTFGGPGAGGLGAGPSGVDARLAGELFPGTDFAGELPPGAGGAGAFFGAPTAGAAGVGDLPPPGLGGVSARTGVPFPGPAFAGAGGTPPAGGVGDLPGFGGVSARTGVPLPGIDLAGAGGVPFVGDCPFAGAVGCFPGDWDLAGGVALFVVGAAGGCFPVGVGVFDFPVGVACRDVNSPPGGAGGGGGADIQTCSITCD